MIRVFITGAPRAGKTTMGVKLAAELGVPVIHCDDYIRRGWSESSAHIAALMTDAGPMVLEGVAVPRALRKYLAAHPERPCDRLVVLREPRVALTKGQQAMAKGVETVLAEVLPELRRRGVELVG